MHNLEQLIADWRKIMMTERTVGRETLDELENHLREHAAELVGAGMTEADAFQRAVAQLGSPPTIAAEFQKLNETAWLPVKLLAGIPFMAALLLAILFARSNNLQANLLLASHVFLVTLGYLTVFLTGALGICYVCRRCFSDFSVSRAQSIRRATVIFSSVATGLTTAGVILGAIWAKAEWGRYWTWDPKETGALCVIVWMILFVCADRVSRFSVRTILVMSILGNVIVSLAWFGANLWASLHSYGTQYYLMLLLAVVISNLAAFVIGLGPAGWLRLRKV